MVRRRPTRPTTTAAACTLIAALACSILAAAPRAFAADYKWSEIILILTGLDPDDPDLGGGAPSIRQAPAATTTWYLYPGACNDRVAGTWSPHSSIVADSLNTYSTGSVPDHDYPIVDWSLQQDLWHITDGTESPDVGSGLVLSGVRSLWCGRYDPSGVVPSGYPNDSYQILYLDTGAHGSTYTFSWTQNVSTEFSYDFLYLIGGGDSAADPIGNSRARLDQITATGADGDAELLVTETGSIATTLTLSYSGGGVYQSGNASGAPATVTGSISGIPSKHRALYILLACDPGFSNQDGLWPFGHGVILDDLSTSDNGSIYTDETPSGGVDAYDGVVLKGTSSNPIISARVAPGAGAQWHIQAGNTLPTADYCSPQKQLSIDRMFEGSDGNSHLTVNGAFGSIQSCSFPVPGGTSSILAVWGEYIDLPRPSGFVQLTEFRYFKGGVWSDWIATTASRSEGMGALQAWTTDWADLSEATQADSVQLQFTLKCLRYAATDHRNCQPVAYGIFYDNLRLQVTTGVPAPTFRIFPGSLAQSTFVDGTDPLSTGCSVAQITAGQCWPGVRGSNAAAIAGPIHDNFNAPIGDSITTVLASGLRSRGMGINWQYGFDRSLLDGRRITRSNGGYNAALGTPAWIYRIFDPATLTWSPWDSSALDANSAAISGSDTIVVDSEFRLNWPPRDKYYVNQSGADVGPSADADLPGTGGGWSLNGNSKYSQVPFLPQGARIQYYFKAVDVGGGVAYQFYGDRPALEVEDLPLLPGSSIRAPDIIEFDVLPRVYPPGTAGTLAAGQTDTRVLNLDGVYTAWSNGFDPVTQALRAMGVRADRYRNLQGMSEGGNVGGRELPGARVSRLGNYFPNDGEYGIKDLLANSYNIFIQSSHVRGWGVVDEQDAHLIEQWWLTDTGVNGGDRCILGTGDGMFNALLNASKSFPDFTEQVNLAQNVFGVASCIDAWTGTTAVPYPTIDDRFAGGGPGLASPGTFTYPVDGGCPGPNRFDGLTKIGPADAENAVFYPGGVPEVAGVSYSAEKDPGGAGDNDRNKALAYGFSIQFIRRAGIPTTGVNYAHSGVQNRMRVLYKFLTSCRQTTSGTVPCWPCPSNPSEMTSNWATATGFQTGTYGALFPIQDYTTATGVPEEGPGAPGFVNALSQNRPNPFNPETAIPYSLSANGRVTIRIFDVAGRLVRTLVDTRQTAGPHVVRWNGTADRGRPLASGIYFYTIRYPDGATSARKLTILR